MVRTHLFMVVALAFGILSACGEVKDDSVEGTDACAEVTCGENASCVDADGDASCECDDGYAGDGQDCCSDEDGDGECDVDSVSIALSSLSTTATFFEYQGETTVIEYFAVLDDGGDPHLAFDACDICYAARRGYSQEGSVMVCNNCGNQFDITGIGTSNTGGGCWPGYLPITVTETDVVILLSDLESGSWYFE